MESRNELSLPNGVIDHDGSPELPVGLEDSCAASAHLYAVPLKQIRRALPTHSVADLVLSGAIANVGTAPWRTNEISSAC